MTKSELYQLYSSLESPSKTQFLATLSNQLTILMRGDYDESIDHTERIKRLMGANELQHHISSELGHHLNRDVGRYPDEVLLNILLEKANYYALANKLQYALISTAKRFRS